MKLIKTASGKQTIKISKSEWKAIGKTTGWMRKAFQPSAIGHEQDIMFTFDPDPNKLALNLIVTVKIVSVNSTGVGPYEYWGAKHNDKGTNYVEDWEITDVKLDSNDQVLTLEQKKNIIQVLDRNEEFKNQVEEEMDLDQAYQNSVDEYGDFKYDEMKDEGRI